MKLQLTFVCLTSLALAACGGGGDGSTSDDPKDENAETGDGDGDSGGDGDGDKSGDGDGDGDGDSTGDGDGDGDNAGDGDGDAGDGDGDGDGDTGGDGDAAPQAPDVELSATPKVPGLPSAVSATFDEGASIVWTLSGQPEGSALEDADIEGSDAADASIVAQLAGEYELTAEVTLDGETTTKRISFEVKGYDIPFTTLTVVPGEGESYLASHVSKVVSSGGGEAKDIGCVYESDEFVENSNLASTRHRGTAVHLPLEVDEPALVYSQVQSPIKGEYLRLEYSDSNTHCEEAPPELMNVGTPVSVATIPYRPSPSGQRIVAVSDEDPEFLIFTYGPGGQDAHAIVSGQPDATPHMAWMDETNLAITTGNDDGEGGYEWSMHAVPDKDAGGLEATKIMDCSALEEERTILPSTLFQFREGVLFLRSSKGGIYRMEAEDGIYNCDITSGTNRLLTMDDLIANFDVSTDGSLVTYQALDNVIKAVESEDGSVPYVVSPDDGTDHVYPHFALGGMQIVWTSQYQYVAPEEGQEAPFDGNVTRVFRANADASHPYVVWSDETPAEVTTVSTLGDRTGTNCSFGIPLGGGPAGLVAFALSFGVVLRRRKKNR